MVWLVVALPLASVIAGIALLVIAARSGSTDAVADPVQRTAQIQVTDLGPDAVARQLRLTAILRTDANLVEVLPVTGAFERDAPLRLALHHPARADADRELLLQPTERGWSTVASVDGSHDWNARIAPEGGAWRLQGRLPMGQRAAHLQSSLSGPERP
jgi:hypothetical protein